MERDHSDTTIVQTSDAVGLDSSRNTGGEKADRLKGLGDLMKVEVRDRI